MCSTWVPTYILAMSYSSISVVCVPIGIQSIITNQVHVHSNQTHIIQQYNYTGHTFHYTSASVLSHSPCLIHPIPWLSLLDQFENQFLAAIKVNVVVMKEQYSIKASMHVGHILANLFCAVIIQCEGQLTTYTSYVR